jgi:HSP20 family protein
MTFTKNPNDAMNDSAHVMAAHPVLNPDTSEQQSANSYPSATPQEASARPFHPPSELQESDRAFSIYIDLPGVNSHAINITSCPTSVTIQGQRSHVNTDARLLKSDRPQGDFVRTIQLPEPVVSDQVYAEYSHGVLRLELPKQVNSAPAIASSEASPEASPEASSAPACQTVLL